jgi:hypothetical protein
LDKEVKYEVVTHCGYLEGYDCGNATEICPADFTTLRCCGYCVDKDPRECDFACEVVQECIQEQGGLNVK